MLVQDDVAVLIFLPRSVGTLASGLGLRVRVLVVGVAAVDGRYGVVQLSWLVGLLAVLVPVLLGSVLLLLHLVVATDLVLAHFKLLVDIVQLACLLTQVDVPDLQVLTDLAVVVDLLPLRADLMIRVAIVVGVPVHEDVLLVLLKPDVVFFLHVVYQVLLVDFSHALWAALRTLPVIDGPQVSVEDDAQPVDLALEVLLVEEDHLLVGGIQVLTEAVELGHDGPEEVLVAFYLVPGLVLHGGQSLVDLLYCPLNNLGRCVDLIDLLQALNLVALIDQDALL